MRRRLLFTAVLAATVTCAFTGCVFVPGLVGSNPPAETPPAATDTADPVEATDPTATEPAESADPVETSESTSTDAEWPAEVPVPEGERYPSEDDPLFYMVDGDDAAYEAYLDELEAAGFESSMDSEMFSVWEGHGYHVTVMLLGGMLSVSVSEG